MPKKKNSSDDVGSSKSESLSLKKRAIMAEPAQKLCGSCHETCARCNGPLYSDCVTCNDDFIVSGKVCLHKASVTTWNILEALQHDLGGYSPLEITVISFVIIASLVICVAVYTSCRKPDTLANAERDKTFSGKYSYNPIVQDNAEIMLMRAPAPASDDETDFESDDTGL